MLSKELQNKSKKSKNEMFRKAMLHFLIGKFNEKE